MLKMIGAVLLFVVIIVGLLAIGGAMLLSLSYGLGLLFSLLTHFEPFQSTVLALVAILAAGILAERIWTVIISSNSSPLRNKLDDTDPYEDEFEDDAEDEDEIIFTNPGIPRWRQPLKQVDFSNTELDSRCPCGSGRKFKNCHGSIHKSK
jgi:hypothetical protein